MKIGTIINAYNEAEWLETCIESLIDFVHELVITEGAYQMAINVGANPRSTDGTLDILNKYKNHEKVTVLHENEFEQSSQLNKGLEVLKKKGVDWLLMVDADEIWSPSNLIIARNAMIMGDKNGVYQYWVHFRNFTNSFDQYFDTKFRRIFKVTPGCRFIFRNENMEWPDHGKAVDTEVPVPHVSSLSEACKVNHYTEIKSGKRWLLKREYLIKRTKNPVFQDWKLTRDGVWHQRSKDVKPFLQKHPKIVQENKLYKLWEEDPEKFKHELFGQFVKDED
jgi:glycosyltransferase involved in cell wall biosynthesis